MRHENLHKFPNHLQSQLNNESLDENGNNMIHFNTKR